MTEVVQFASSCHALAGMSDILPTCAHLHTHTHTHTHTHWQGTYILLTPGHTKIHNGMYIHRVE